MYTDYVKEKVEDDRRKSKSRSVKFTRGFLRVQKKIAHRLELVPEESLIAAMDLAHKEHCCWITSTEKMLIDHLCISNPKWIEPV